MTVVISCLLWCYSAKDSSQWLSEPEKVSPNTVNIPKVCVQRVCWMCCWMVTVCSTLATLLYNVLVSTNQNLLMCWGCSCGPARFPAVAARPYLRGLLSWRFPSQDRQFNRDDFTDGLLMLHVMLENKYWKKTGIKHTVDPVLILFPPVQCPFTVLALLLCWSVQ